MKNKMIFVFVMFCLLILPTRSYGATQNSVPFITRGELDTVQSAQIMINNKYGELQPGEYFTINLIGAEFDLDSNGDPRVFSQSIEFTERSKKSVTGRFLDNVIERESLSISFYSKILEDEAKVEIDGEDSNLTSGTYTYATNSDSDISYKGQVEIDVERPFYDSIALQPIIIKEKYNGALRSSQMYEYNIQELIKLEIPKGEYEFYDREFIHPITIVVEELDGEETRYELGRDMEVSLNPERNILTFKQYNQDILQSSAQLYTIRIENLQLKATKPERTQDVYMNLTGKWLEEQEVLIAKQVTDKLILQTSIEEMQPGSEHRVKFVLEEAKPNTLLTTGEISLGLTDDIKIDFQHEFKLKLTDGIKTYNQEQSSFKIDKEGSIFTIQNFVRTSGKNLIRIEGEFTAQLPNKVDNDIRFLVSDPGVPGVLYSTVLEGYEKHYRSKVQFIINQDTYKIDGVRHPIDAKPYMSTHSRIMVPFRYVAYALGVDTEDLKWDGPSQTITLEGDKPMTINITTGDMVVDGKTSILSEVSLMGGRTFVPVGEIGRAFGVEVDWDEESRTATFN